MNEKEINEAFDREYEVYSKDHAYRIIRACQLSTANSDINYFALEKIIEDIKAGEREACAKLFDAEVWAYDYREIAAAIRARGNT